MQHKCKVTVIDKKLYPELQQQYCANKESGMCPCYNIGDEFIFERYGAKDDFWHMGLNTAITETSEAGSKATPHCSEAWDAISRYIYTALQGGSIMHGWMDDDRIMIACCSDGTRPVIFKIERQDYKVLYIEGFDYTKKNQKIEDALLFIPDVSAVEVKKEFIEVFVEKDFDNELLRKAIATVGAYTVSKID